MYDWRGDRYLKAAFIWAPMQFRQNDLSRQLHPASGLFTGCLRGCVNAHLNSLTCPRYLRGCVNAHLNSLICPRCLRGCENGPWWVRGRSPGSPHCPDKEVAVAGSHNPTRSTTIIISITNNFSLKTIQLNRYR